MSLCAGLRSLRGRLLFVTLFVTVLAGAGRGFGLADGTRNADGGTSRVFTNSQQANDDLGYELLK